MMKCDIKIIEIFNYFIQLIGYFSKRKSNYKSNIYNSFKFEKYSFLEI